MTTPAARVRHAVATAERAGTDTARAAAVRQVSPTDVELLLHTQFAPVERVVLVRGIPASPGAATGRIYFTAEDAMDAADRGEHVVLACAETNPADEIAMRLSDGILTSRGGLVSHAAVVARGWGIPAVCGASGIDFGDRSMTVGEVTVHEGDLISLDGGTGEVMLGELEVGAEPVPHELDTLLGWADGICRGRLSVRANVDTGSDAALARSLGAAGVGLCRTEHQFLGDKLPIVQRYILADSPFEQAAALDELAAAHRGEFRAVLQAMDGLPVTVRLLDPPLHEFLPSADDPSADPRLRAAVRNWHEHNPMLGARGVRLGILRPALYRAQVRALVQAALDRRAEGGTPVVQVMVPFVVDAVELGVMRRWLDDELSGHGVDVAVGTMIETPRAALVAGELAEVADFFSFGTNDLTQMVYGFSRDDVERRLLGAYEALGILAHSPFESLDRSGVGTLVRNAVVDGRARRPHLEVGVCGEHAGDPGSIAFFLGAGVDYLSCSPYRVPVARLAAAHAVLAASDPAGPW